ncbi:MAG: hypothetical protein HKO57_06385, partial [Akkermansiaceae bacterium]|nr:hypothetical protein [Akkermansiaceae bacterium]
MADERFRAYSFVDRITSVEPGMRVCGSYSIPEGASRFPVSLAAEATGQLAAWAAMAEVDFAVRPVAGIAGGIAMLTVPEPGQTLDLEAAIERVDAEAISYSGTASVGGRPVVRLEDCVGPMVPMEDYDDPAAVRERYGVLRGGGAEPGAFRGVPEIGWKRAGGEPGEELIVRLQVPESAAFFGDHFPRRPVFPGTLMMDVNNEIAGAFMTETAPP